MITIELVKDLRQKIDNGKVTPDEIKQWWHIIANKRLLAKEIVNYFEQMIVDCINREFALDNHK